MSKFYTLSLLFPLLFLFSFLLLLLLPHHLFLSSLFTSATDEADGAITSPKRSLYVLDVNTSTGVSASCAAPSGTPAISPTRVAVGGQPTPTTVISGAVNAPAAVSTTIGSSAAPSGKAAKSSGKAAKSSLTQTDGTWTCTLRHYLPIIVHLRTLHLTKLLPCVFVNNYIAY